MKIETLKELEHSIGGRPKLGRTKVRMTFYLSKTEAEQLRSSAIHHDQPVSQVIRSLVQKYIQSQNVASA